MKETDEKIWDVQGGFRNRRTDQIFSVRSIIEKHLAIRQKVFCEFIDLEKVYDRVVRNDLWSTLLMYGVDSQMVRAL